MSSSSSFHSNPAVTRAVERQMRNWEIARAQRGPAAAAKPSVHDFIALSRAVGAGGGAIAAALGERLGWPVFDQQILNVMAGDDESRQRVYASMDERDLTWCEEVLRSLMGHEFKRNDYFHCLSRTIVGLARQGPAVFLGRGADVILPRDKGLRVRLVAPMRMCVANYAARHNLPPEKAEAAVRENEKNRAEFVRHHFHIATDAPDRFDLVINLGTFSAEKTVELILAARGVMAARSA